VYFVMNEEQNNFGYLYRVPLAGGSEETAFVGDDGLRGIALDATHVYWATQGEGGAIGRMPQGEFVSCAFNPSCEKEFIDIDGAPNGLTLGTTHLFWAVNGDTSSNPGNDLYRYAPATDTLTDLTPLATGNGAEVQGVLGVSADGSNVYFAANGVLAAGASQGSCKGSVKTASGKCNLYAWHGGEVDFVAPLDANGVSDALNWVGSPLEVLNSGSYVPKTALLGDGGEVLIFRSRERLTAYDNEGVPEFYRYRADEPGELSCLTCRPSGETAGGGSQLGSFSTYFGIQPLHEVQAVATRNLSADGERFFFESPEALSPNDTNAADGCPPAPNGRPSCLDVYQWVAPDTGDCEEGGPNFSPLNEGCLYLLSTGKSEFPSYFGDASEDGSSAFLFTRERLVGQDQDELQDAYAARVGGGLAAQNPAPVFPCESAEACHGPAQAPPAAGSPATPSFFGPGNVSQKHKKAKAKPKQKKKKKKQQQKKRRRAKAKAGRGR